MGSSNNLTDIQTKVKTIKGDSLVKILLENSLLTETQMETLLIDLLADDSTEIKMNYDEKAKIRITNARITRGAFNRTLKQARRNIVYSVYTLLLLGYLGILSTPSLNPLIEASNKLEEYVKAHNDLWEEVKTKAVNKNRIDSVFILRKELESTLFELMTPKPPKKKV